MKTYMGIDVGSTGCKVMIFDGSWKPLRHSYRSYQMKLIGERGRELDPEEVFEKVLQCIKECCEDGTGQQVCAISVSSQGEALIPLDKNKAVLFGAMTCFDSRCYREVEAMKQVLGEAEVFEKTGLSIHSTYTLPKLLWLRKTHREIYDKIAHILCFGDYIAYKLGAPMVMDYTLASRTLLFNVAQEDWDSEILKTFQIDRKNLPPVKPSGTFIGNVDRDLAKEVGLCQEARLVTGGHDQICCCLGAGVWEAGTGGNSMGTTDSIVSIAKARRKEPTGCMINLPCGSFAMPGLYANHGFVLTTGSAVKWFREKILGLDSPRSEFSHLESCLSELKGPTGCFFRPYLSGTGTPKMDSHAKASFEGLTLNHDYKVMYKAILEGICYELKHNLNLLKESGIKINRIKCIGGGSASDEYLQLKADILGIEIVRAREKESGCLGAAILAKSSFTDIISVMKERSDINEEEIFSPKAEISEEYEELFKKYSKDVMWGQ